MRLYELLRDCMLALYCRMLQLGTDRKSSAQLRTVLYYTQCAYASGGAIDLSVCCGHEISMVWTFEHFGVLVRVVHAC